MKHSGRIYSEQVHLLLTCLLVFALPFYKAVVTVLIIMLFINSLFNIRIKNYFLNISDKYFLSIIALYAIYALGIFYTQNLTAGKFDLQVKLSLLILPLIFISSHRFTAIQQKKIINFFISGCFVSSTACLIKAAVKYDVTGKKVFFYEELSYFMHPSYFAMYISLAIVFFVTQYFY